MSDYYKLFLDKATTFECKIQLEGAEIKNAKARVVLESANHNMLFEGTVDSVGNCKIPIKKLSGLFNEGDSGKIRLEVIAENSFFEPWSSEYMTDVSKKMRVEVASVDEKQSGPKLTVEVRHNSPQQKLISEIVGSLHQKKITKENIGKKMHVIKKEIQRKISEGDIDYDVHSIISGVVNKL